MTNNTILNAPHLLEPCPFCGDTPELPSGDGTQYEIECSGCGQAMAGVQICDLMTFEERAADTLTDYRYGEEFVERAKAEAIERWNTRAPSPAGADGLEVVAWVVTGFSSPKKIGKTRRAFVVTSADAETQHANWLPHYNRVTTDPLCRLSDAQAIIDGLRGELDRSDRARMNQFETLAKMQAERCKLAGLLREKFPRIDPHHPLPLSEVDHCCEYVLHKDRERLHCAIDAALSAGKEGE